MRIDMENIYRWLAWKLPKNLAKWAYIRVFAYSTSVHPTKTPDEITYSQTAKAWERQP